MSGASLGKSQEPIVSCEQKPAVAKIDFKEETKPRQWLDIIALIVSVLTFGFTFYTFYFTQLRLADDLSATIIELGPGTDTNGFYTIEVGLLLRNEGNRQALVSQIRLGLSETPTFDLTVWNGPSNTAPIVVGAKQTIYERFVFGAGRTKYQMIETRAPDTSIDEEGKLMIDKPSGEPIIHGKLAVDVMDSRGQMHQENTMIGTFQRGAGLRVSPSFSLPYCFKLLPSQHSITNAHGLNARGSVSFEFQVSVNTNALSVDSTGPLGYRLHGAYTNAHDGDWQFQPLEREMGFSVQASLIDNTGAVHGIHTSQHIGNIARNEVERVLSKDRLHIASVIMTQTNHQVVVSLDGKDGPAFDAIGRGSLLFSSDNKRLAYVAEKGDRSFVVLDGNVGPQFDLIWVNSMAFSRDNKHLAYVARTGSKSVVVLDGKAGMEFDGIVVGSLAFREDSQHLVYMAFKDGKYNAVVDGRITGTLVPGKDGMPGFAGATNVVAPILLPRDANVKPKPKVVPNP